MLRRLRTVFRRRCVWCHQPLVAGLAVRGVQGWYCCEGCAAEDLEASQWA